MDEPGSIATYYKLDQTQPAPLAIGGLRGFAANDRREPSRKLLALQIRPELPPRARALLRLGQGAVPNTLTPLDQGPGRDPSGQEHWFILTAQPPGPPLAATQAWTEAEAMNCLLRPAAEALDSLAQRGVTHRAIRPNNLFRAGPGEPVTLGPFWAAPPASLQQAAFEPPYAAMCLPCGRGDGTIADDVYALGATLLWCVLGGPALWGDDAALLSRKLEHGSLPALAGSAQLTNGLHELLRLMLAEDPDHRPSPALLMAPDQARARRLATRPQVRAQQPLELAGRPIWTARELAYGLATQPERGLALLRGGLVDRWLRRMLGESQLAVALEEAVVAAARDAPAEDASQQAVALMRAALVLDPLAPLAWRGTLVFPDGLGPALVAAQAAGQAAITASLEEIIANEAAALWAPLQAKRRDLINLKQEARDWRGWLATRGPMGGLRRVVYALNPLLPCGCPLLAGRLVGRLSDLLPALDAAAPRADRKRPPIDAHIAAYVAARADSTLIADIGIIEGFATVAERLSVLRLFARLQARLHPDPLPGLAGWLLESGLIDIDLWRNLHTRKSVSARLAEAAAAGQIGTMLNLAQDESAQHADRAGAENAAFRSAAIATELKALAASGPRRQREAEKLGHDIATSTALAMLVGAAILLGLSV